MAPQTGPLAEAAGVPARVRSPKTSTVLSAARVAKLRDVAGRFTDRAALEKARLLRACSASTIDDPGVLLAYHDCLLFLLAYPQTPELRAVAERELARVSADARGLAGRGEWERWTLEDSGVAWSETRVAVSYAIAQWLTDRYPKHVELAFFADGGEPLRTVLKLCIPELEESALVGDRPAKELLEQLTRDFPGSQLEWLVGHLALLPCSEEIRDHLFESLRAYVMIRPHDGPLSRTFARGLGEEPFYHRDALVRRVDPQSIMSEPLPRPRRLSIRDRLYLIDTARAVLISLARETDPISLCVPGGVEYLELGRGISIALYSMPPARRLPIDSHLGFLLFKNAVPVAYGGGWPFLGLCRIGIHVFAPYRGGESAHAFCQVLRVYHQRFGIRHFVAEPSQFGEREPDGLSSGAFWFYYRLGFRPVDRAITRLAEEEFARMTVGSDRRTPVRLLRRLAGSSLEFVLPGGDSPTAHCDAADLSTAVTSWIGTQFQGDRAAAEQAALEIVSRALRASGMERWPEPERRSFRSLSLLLAMIPDLGRWPGPDRRRALAIMRAKGRPDERAYFDLMRSHRRFCDAMVHLAATV